jgi:hypothetical protein
MWRNVNFRWKVKLKRCKAIPWSNTKSRCSKPEVNCFTLFTGRYRAKTSLNEKTTNRILQKFYTLKQRHVAKAEHTHNLEQGLDIFSILASQYVLGIFRKGKLEKDQTSGTLQWTGCAFDAAWKQTPQSREQIFGRGLEANK